MGYHIKKSSNGVTVEFYDVDATLNRIVNNNAVGRFTAETWAKEFSKYVPMDSGILFENYTTQPWLVTYESPYAHYQWQGELYVSPTTGSPWALADEVKVPAGRPLRYDTSKHALATSHWEEVAYKAKAKDVAEQISQFILLQ